jgi:hypothetical protein
VFPELNDDGRALFAEHFETVGKSLEKKFGQADSSEDEDKEATKRKEQAILSSVWASLNVTTNNIRRIPRKNVGEVVSSTFPCNFTCPKQIFKDKAGAEEKEVREEEGMKDEADAEEEVEVKEDEAEKKQPAKHRRKY